MRAYPFVRDPCISMHEAKLSRTKFDADEQAMKVHSLPRNPPQTLPRPLTPLDFRNSSNSSSPPLT